MKKSLITNFILTMGFIFMTPTLALSQSLEQQAESTTPKENALSIIEAIRSNCNQDDEVIEEVVAFLKEKTNITESSSGYQDVACSSYYITYETVVSACSFDDSNDYEYSMRSDESSIFGAFQKISYQGKCRLDK